MPNKTNEKQNIFLARLEERISSLEKRFDKFIENDFNHLRYVIYAILLAIVGQAIISWIK